MTVQLYFGAYNAPDYWDRPHAVEINNVALNVSAVVVAGKKIVTIHQIFVRNHGDETVYNAVDVTICGLAYGTQVAQDKDAQVQSALDLTGLAMKVPPPAGTITDIHWAMQWTNRSVLAYSAVADNPTLILEEAQPIGWQIPRPINYFVIAATLQCTTRGIAPQPPPTQDPCTAVWFGNF